MQGNFGRQSRKGNMFGQSDRWRPDDAAASFIRLTSFKGKSTEDQHGDSVQKTMPLEFCDMEADESAFADRECTSDDSLWRDPQGDFQADE